MLLSEWSARPELALYSLTSPRGLGFRRCVCLGYAGDPHESQMFALGNSQSTVGERLDLAKSKLPNGAFPRWLQGVNGSLAERISMLLSKWSARPELALYSLTSPRGLGFRRCFCLGYAGDPHESQMFALGNSQSTVGERLDLAKSKLPNGAFPTQVTNVCTWQRHFQQVIKIFHQRVLRNVQRWPANAGT